jgi:serine/threonine-protein kinase
MRLLPTRRFNLTLATTLAVPLVGFMSPQALAGFGAIAYSDITKGHGYSYDYATRGDAERRALKECEFASRMAGDCRVLVWFQNACGALATARNGAAGSGWGSTRPLAHRYAMQSCMNYGGRGCRVVRMVCTD